MNKNPKEKADDFFIGLGALAIIIIPAFLFNDYQKVKKIEKLESAYYKMEDKILEMSDYNDNIFKKTKANETYDFYNFDDFERVLFKYEDTILELTQPNKSD